MEQPKPTYQDENTQTTVLENEKSPAGTFRGPIKQMLRIFPSYKEPEFIYGRSRYSAHSEESPEGKIVVVKRMTELTLEQVLDYKKN